MHDFGRLVYLDMHKSGSSFVTAFLRDCCICDEVAFKKHAPITRTYDPRSFYFITIRHPVGLYSSLYRFGLDGHGAVRNRLREAGALECYSSFPCFVDFMLNPRNAPLLGEGFNERLAEQMGFMSFRFLRLSLRFPNRQIRKSLRRGDRLLDLQSNFITDLEIKNEELTIGLLNLATKTLPECFDQGEVLRFLSGAPRVNASSTPESSVPSTHREEVSSMIRGKEALLLSRYH